MKYLFFVCTDSEAEPYDPVLDNIGDWVTEMTASGRRETGNRLRPVEAATTVRLRSGEVLVTKGPSSGTKDTIAGFDIIEASTLDEAIDCAAQHPMARFGLIEIRPFWPFE